ncbi:MAG: hypothetical protein KF764_24315 [Labilithrix sp.]|nr:hypothetical protein [Labilithrix sp.]MBX3221736.1 hypothetical protein [Labilithrix sp.]
MSDDLTLPQVPEARPEDPEDVSWALSTAEAMWARGDHSDGIKWVRRAAEAASEAEDDARALELAKAAADLTGLISKRVSRASIDIEEVDPMSEPSPPPAPPARPAAPVKPSKPPGSTAPAPFPTSVTKLVVTPSRPPAPLPSRTSQPPAARGSQPPRGKPLGTNTPSKPASMRPAAGGTKKASRKSRENLDAEARAALQAADTAQQFAVDARTAGNVLPADTAETAAVQVPAPRDRHEIGNNDPTFVGHVSEIVRPVGRSTDEWDASPTQNLTGDELAFATSDGDRMTTVGAPPTDFKTTMQSFPRPGAKTAATGGAPGGPTGGGSHPPATVAGSMLTHEVPAAVQAPRVAPNEQHDPGIVTSQAVRVVVWRDANGVHVAPAGTVVSAITVDAVLVALEPNADLTAWLTQKGR